MQPGIQAGNTPGLSPSLQNPEEPPISLENFKEPPSASSFLFFSRLKFPNFHLPGVRGSRGEEGDSRRFPWHVTKRRINNSAPPQLSEQRNKANFRRIFPARIPWVLSLFLLLLFPCFLQFFFYASGMIRLRRA